MKVVKGNTVADIDPKRLAVYLENGWKVVGAVTPVVKNEALKDLTVEQLADVAKNKGLNSKGKKPHEIAKDIEVATVDVPKPEEVTETFDDGLVVDETISDNK